MTPKEQAEIKTDVVRQVLWGQPQEAVLSEAVAKGVSRQQASKLHREALAVRYAIIRKKAPKKVAVGIPFLVHPGS